MCWVMPPASVSTTAVFADRVEQRRLAVVDVPHDRDDRRAGLERLVRVVERLGLVLLLAGVLDRHLALERFGDRGDLVVGEGLRRGLHRAEIHQHLDDLAHRDAERLREVAQRDAGLDGHGPARCDDLAWLLGAAVDRPVAGALALAGPRPSAAAFDDDAPLPVPRSAAASWSDWSSAWHLPLKCRAARARARHGRLCEVCG